MPKKKVLLTDLDNTLFDWVELWVECFTAFLDSLAEISGIPKNALIPEIKSVHQKHGTSEYSMLIEEVPLLVEFLAGRQATHVFKKSIDIYRDRRRDKLKLYPSVADTLLKIKGKGALIVGYTESMAFYSNYRIKRLGLDGVLDYVFCPHDHELPSNIDLNQMRHYPSNHYDLSYTNLKFTPAGSKKPSTIVLKSILESLSVEPENAVYVGDSLMKDIAMAQDTGVQDIWAKFGQAHTRPEYALLRQVTHWTADDVEREQLLKERTDITPSYTLENEFSQILKVVDFTDFARGGLRAQRKI